MTVRVSCRAAVLARPDALRVEALPGFDDFAFAAAGLGSAGFGATDAVSAASASADAALAFAVLPATGFAAARSGFDAPEFALAFATPDFAALAFAEPAFAEPAFARAVFAGAFAATPVSDDAGFALAARRLPALPAGGAGCFSVDAVLCSAGVFGMSSSRAIIDNPPHP
ncbi:hypothetical protein [Paracoccus shanxieyensis]|uniref:hypothetical protein n=1 Tax=Paracoccus shanxieyensis TaxID=2675752 RepID=UPI001E38371E|nr:hypothetical protein [Paracoccus shanxieyensis]